MSAIVGYRDKLLQAAPVRNIAPAADAFLLLQSDTTVFHETVNSAGAVTGGSPGAINLTAALYGLPTLTSADITFAVVSGTAALSGSGGTRQLAYSSMTTNSATVRASVTYSGVTFFMELIIAKVKDGASGLPGTPGVIGKSSRIAFTLADQFSLNYNPSSVTIAGDNRPPAGTWGEARAWQAAIDSAPAAGQAWFQTNGNYDATAGVNTTVWTTPYLSNLKVGNLQAISTNTGALIFTDTCQSANGNVRINADGTFRLAGSASGMTSEQTGAYLRFYASGVALPVFEAGLLT